MGWKESIRIEIIHNHPQFLLIKIFSNFINNHIFVSFVYGNPDRNKRKILWEALKSVVPFDSTPCLLMGDFNGILSPDDKMSFSTVGKHCKYFGDFVDSSHL